MESELEIAAIQSDEVSDVAQPSTNSGIGKHNTKSAFEKMKMANGKKGKKNQRKRTKN